LYGRAVSAGAYTAGVTDYLIETLERWQQKKDEIKKKVESGESLTSEEALVPMHDVIIEVLSGASAGGMTAAVLAYSFNDDTYFNKRDEKIISSNYTTPAESYKPSKL
jgi:predicted acylesterase/phospholipase RssA